jgi:Na+/H+-dicarboxylate symporter
MNYHKKLCGSFSLALFIVSVVCFSIGGVLLGKLESEAMSNLSENSRNLVNNIFKILKSIINYKEEKIIDTIPSGISGTMINIGKIIGLTKKYKIMADASISFIAVGSIFMLISLILFSIFIAK